MEQLNKTLDELEDEEFKKFQRFLREPANLDGEEPIGRARLQNKDRMETADVILQTYPDNVDQIMANILLKVGRKDLYKHYLNNVQSKVAASSVPASSNGAAASVPGASKSATAACPEVDFVNKNKRALIQRVTAVEPILDLLVDEGAMRNEDYSNLRAERTTQGKMRQLFILLDNRGAKAKRVFYQGLDENESYLIEDLNEQG